jgi:hypothetical protein
LVQCYVSLNETTDVSGFSIIVQILICRRVIVSKRFKKSHTANSSNANFNFNVVAPVDADFQSALHIRAPVETPSVYDKTPIFKSVDPSMAIDFSRLVNKPFHLSSFSWSNTSPAGTDVFALPFPSSVISLNRIASAPFDLASLYHLKACFVVQVAGTPMHSGALIAAVTPISALAPGAGTAAGIHSYQTAPHIYLHANSASAACVEIPWYSPTKLRFTPSVNDNQQELQLYGASTTDNTTDYAQLSFRVLSPLGVPTSGSAVLTVTIAVVFKEINFFVPKATYPTPPLAVTRPSSSTSTTTTATMTTAKTEPPDPSLSHIVIDHHRFPSSAKNAQSSPVSSSSIYVVDPEDPLLPVYSVVQPEKASRPCCISHATSHSCDECIGMLVNSLSSTISLATALKHFLQCPPKRAQAQAMVTHGLDSFAQAAKTFTADVVDSARSWVRMYTGLHNPNIRNPSCRDVMAMRNNPNYVDKETYLYKLDPYAQHCTPMEEYHSDCSHDEGLISSVISKNMIVAVPGLSTSTVVGTPLFVAPISPFMFRSSTSPPVISAPIHKIAYMSKFWSGDLVLTLQNLGSAFHMYKLLVVREYFSSYQMVNAVPPMSSVVNHPADVVEFSSGGQTQEIVLKMGAIFDEIPCTNDYLANGMVHGRVMVYLLQPLVTNGAVPTNVSFAVHVRAAPNFHFYGYATEDLSFTPAPPGLIAKTAQSAEVPVNMSADPGLVSSSPASAVPSNSNFRPIVHVRDLARRMVPSHAITFSSASISNSGGVVSFSVADLIGTTANGSPLSILSSMFYGYRGGLKVKLLIRGADDVVVTYVPPGASVGTPGTSTPYPVRLLAQIFPASVVASTAHVASSVNRVSAFRVGARLFSGPMLESQDFRISHSSLDSVGTTVAGEQATDPLASSVIAEFEIPWMNPCRFVPLSQGNSAARGFGFFAASLGNIQIGINTQYDNDIGAGTTTVSPVVIYPYIGIDDFGRHLYQTVTYPLYAPTIGAGAYPGTVLDTELVSAGPQIGTGTTNEYPPTPATNAFSYYVGNL